MDYKERKKTISRLLEIPSKRENYRISPSDLEITEALGKKENRYAVDRMYGKDEFDYIVCVYASRIPVMSVVSRYFDAEKKIVSHTVKEEIGR